MGKGADDIDVTAFQDKSIDALEMLGDQALPAVPALTRALADPDLFVRWAAARTLGKMVPADFFDEVQRLLREYRTAHAGRPQ